MDKITNIKNNFFYKYLLKWNKLTGSIVGFYVIHRCIR